MVEELLKALWSYKTTMKTPIGEIPFALAYGSEVMSLVEVGLPTCRTCHITPNIMTRH